ncbi:MAG: hypothetical protein JNL83_15060 [Myxococcales bacterium]|nr:hypothetical protein [Myxococcales bacterium]
MRGSHLALGMAAAGVLGLGIWIGRSSSASSEAAPAPTQPAASSAEPRSAALPARATAPAPTQPPTLAKPVSRMLAADLEDSDPKVRRAATRDLAKHPDSDPQRLLALSRDADVGVGILAMEGLGRLHASGNLPAAELIARVGDHALDEKVRTAAFNALGVVPSPEAAQYLAGLLANGSSFERLNAAILIGHQDLEVAVPALIRALSDGEPRVRDNALETLRTWTRGRDFGSDAAAWQAWWQSRPR